MKIKPILSIFLISVFTISTAYAEKPVAISKADGPNSLELGISVDVGSHKIMRNQIYLLVLIYRFAQKRDFLSWHVLWNYKTYLFVFLGGIDTI